MPPASACGLPSALGPFWGLEPFPISSLASDKGCCAAQSLLDHTARWTCNKLAGHLPGRLTWANCSLGECSIHEQICNAICELCRPLLRERG